MGNQPAPYVFYRDKLVPFSDANVSIASHAVQYGIGCFEGIRSYCGKAGHHLLHLERHFARLHRSAKTLRLNLDYSVEELIDISKRLCQENDLKCDSYLRVAIVKAATTMRLGVPDEPDLFAMIERAFTPSYEDDAVHVSVSAWRRIADMAAPVRAKATGLYLNSALALEDARLSGFDDAILLNEDGSVSEATTSNVFIVRDGAVHTPDISQNILEGITRESVIHYLREEAGVNVNERQIGPTELYCADEIFLTGTAVEICPVGKVDHRIVGTGAIGPITARLRSWYACAVRGLTPEYHSWLTSVKPIVSPSANEMKRSCFDLYRPTN